MDTNNHKIPGLDLIRATAITFVVLNHTVELCASLHSVETVNAMTSAARWTSLIAFTLGRLGVPLFFFLSGYLLLPRTFDPQSTQKFYRRNFLSLLATWELWIIIYNLILESIVALDVPPDSAFFFDRKELHVDTLLRNMIFVEGVGLAHVWYVSVILGIYLFVPIVARALKTVSDRELITLITLAFAYYLVLPTVAHFTERPLMMWIDLTFSGGLYGFYVVLGYILRRFERSIPTIGLIIPTIGAILATAWIQLSAYERGEVFLVWYDCCLLPIAAFGLFILLRRATLQSPAIENPIVARLSRYSFGIYLLHAPILIAFMKFDVTRSTALWTVAAIGLSLIAIELLGLIPGGKKFLFRVVRKY